jgi:hypothetical protein
MRWLKILLALNGVVFLWRAFNNIFRPTSFYLLSDAPKYAVDAVRVIGISFIALGLIQLGTWWVVDRLAVRIVAGASLLFAVGFVALAAMMGSTSADAFHRIRFGSIAENTVVVVLYAILLFRTGQTATV